MIAAVGVMAAYLLALAVIFYGYIFTAWFSPRVISGGPGWVTLSHGVRLDLVGSKQFYPGQRVELRR